MSTTIKSTAVSQQADGEGSVVAGIQQAPANLSAVEAEATDVMLDENGRKAARAQIAVVPSDRPTPEKPVNIPHYQIIGADPSKNLFNAAELGNLMKERCKEGQPLILVKNSSNAAPSEKFILGSEYMRQIDQGKIPEQELLGSSAFLFYGSDTKRPDVISLSPLVANDPDFGLLDALLNVNSSHQNDFEVYRRLYLIAAMMRVGIIETSDLLQPTQILKDITEKYKKPSLNAALLECLGHKDPSIAEQLLRWGADANATNSDDHFSALGTAIRYLNEPIVRLLIEHGADPLRETETDCSAEELVTSEPYQGLAPLLKRTPAVL